MSTTAGRAGAEVRPVSEIVIIGCAFVLVVVVLLRRRKRPGCPRCG
jgi:hypothetical protein